MRRNIQCLAGICPQLADEAADRPGPQKWRDLCTPVVADHDAGA